MAYPPPGPYGGTGPQYGPSGPYGMAPPPPPPPKKSSAGLIITLVLGVVLLLVGVSVAGFLWWSYTANQAAAEALDDLEESVTYGVPDPTAEAPTEPSTDTTTSEPAGGTETDSGSDGGGSGQGFPSSYDGVWFDDAPFTVQGQPGTDMEAHTEPGGTGGDITMELSGQSCEWTLVWAEAQGEVHRADATPVSGNPSGCPDVGSVTFEDYGGRGIDIYVGPSAGNETDYIESW
ncbi:hypothetical protein [Allonocardiopsis opalescens]|uniref:Uncharacterized protein n=1 Tax=Allonocardiopsis opalescens TaxID=1144618 RepID=A0A2T0PU53_9ACTN|nr:hypothetical protein [Allonocardiopsis opalescens]PRX92431.1 hypothetical protein CLV72_110191 [Allonocardiopsis opalescens]